MTDARTLTLGLNGRWRGRFGLAPCPICQPERRRDQRGLELSHGANSRLLLRCYKSHCTFADLLAALNVTPDRIASDPEAEARWRAEEMAEAEKRSRIAQRVWDETRPIGGTLAETYLRGRGITCPLPTSLRFAPSCWYSREERFPALVALVEGGAGFAVHRTYLRADGSGKAQVDDPKKMLGNVTGGAVRLAGDRAANLPLIVAEGIETALSLPSGLMREPASVWAALSTWGLKSLRLPTQPGRLTVAADGDTAGRRDAESLAARACQLGWRAGVKSAPDGWDWNDVLRARAHEVAA